MLAYCAHREGFFVFELGGGHGPHTSFSVPRHGRARCGGDRARSLRRRCVGARATPPVAISLFVAIAIARTSMREVEGLIWKFMPALIIALAVTAMVPGVVLVLARLVK